jgi:hypothetical protein
VVNARMSTTSSALSPVGSWSLVACVRSDVAVLHSRTTDVMSVVASDRPVRALAACPTASEPIERTAAPSQTAADRMSRAVE